MYDVPQSKCRKYVKFDTIIFYMECHKLQAENFRSIYLISAV